MKKVTSMKIRKRMIIDTKIHLILWSCSSGVHPDTCNSTREGKKKKTYVIKGNFFQQNTTFSIIIKIHIYAIHIVIAMLAQS